MDTILKAAGAIAISVIGAVIVFYLTGSGGLLNPKPTPVAALHIIDTELLEAHVGQGTVMRFKVYNDGDAKAVDCAVYWTSGEEFSHRYETDTLEPNTSYAFSLSERFELEAGETRTVTSTSRVYEQPGHKYSEAFVGCGNIFSYDVQINRTMIDFTVS